MNIKLLDMVALTDDLPELNLSRGQLGTVVEILAKGFAFEVEFSDPEGRALETVALRPDQLVVRPHKFWRTKPMPDDPDS
ncbi:MAG: DUF4926 domain-containing protein [Caldilineaceae bacterium]|nr:DUF4926 domain-containing protein [Caldilineaceae bacterium]